MPGLDSVLTCTQSKDAALTALQNSITNIHTTIHNEIQNIQTEKNIEITNPQHVSKESHYHTSHTDFLFQRILLKTTTEGNMLYKTIIPHINEKVIMNYRLKH